MTPVEVVLRNARRPDGAVGDVWISDGMVVPAGDPHELPPDAVVHDLDHWLVLPALAEPHAHLDKALSASFVDNPHGDLDGAIRSWGAAGTNGMLTHAEMVHRATATLERMLTMGVTAARSHIDVGSDIGARYVAAVAEARANLGDLMDIQLVGLCRSPIAGPDGVDNRAALLDGLDVGLDLVGGCSYREPEVDAVLGHLLEIAAAAGVGMDLHVDETLDPNILSLPRIAAAATSRGFEFGIGASHCVSLGMQPLVVQHEVAEATAAAGISVVTLPHTNLYLQGRDRQVAMPRALTAVNALVDAGVEICGGGDNVQDPFNPVGRADPLETAALLVLAGHQAPHVAMAMVSNDARRHMGLAPCGVEVGCQADLVAVDTASVRSAIADAPMARRTFRRGRLVASVDSTASIHR